MTLRADSLAHAHAALRDAPARVEAPQGGEWGGGWRRALVLCSYPALAVLLLILAGPWDGWLAVAYVLAGVLLVALVLRSRRRRARRGHLEVSGGSWWWRQRERRELGRLLARWETVAAAGGIPGAKLLMARSDAADGLSVRVSAPGKLVTDVDIVRLQSAAQLAGMFVVRCEDPERPWELQVEELAEVGER